MRCTEFPDLFRRASMPPALLGLVKPRCGCPPWTSANAEALLGALFECIGGATSTPRELRRPRIGHKPAALREAKRRLTATGLLTKAVRRCTNLRAAKDFRGKPAMRAG